MVPNVAGSNPVNRPPYLKQSLNPNLSYYFAFLLDLKLLTWHSDCFINFSARFLSMTIIEALFLGIIQGLTEFLPVSSSGHLELGQYLLGFDSLHRYILFSLICHLGTLGAIFYIFFPQIKNLAFQREMRLNIFLGTLPLFPLVLLIKPIKALFDQPQCLGFCFLITSGLLFISLKLHIEPPLSSAKRRWFDPLTIGLFQAAAILPGISRSGATISAARLLGWNREEAVQFSFLLAIPAICGGTILELWHFIRAPASEIAPIHFSEFIIGFAASFIVGCMALKLLQRLIVQNKWHYFAWYCLLLGLFTIYYFNFIG